MSYNDLRKGRFSEPGREYFVTFVVHKRRKVFCDFHLARIFIQQLQYSEQQSHIKWLAWVLMPDHFHGLLSLNGNDSLATALSRLKGRTSKILNQESHSTGQKFWQNGFYDRALRKEENRKEIARYIVANPIRASIVDNILKYPHWDACWIPEE